MRLMVRHDTTYRYDGQAAYSVQIIRLTPRSNAAQRVLAWRLSAPGRLHSVTDAYGNLAHMMVLDRPHDELRIAVLGEVEPLAVDGFAPADDWQPPATFLRRTRLTEPDAVLGAFAEGFRAAVAADPVAGLESMMHAVRDRVAYKHDATHVGTAAAEAFAEAAGVCQDHSHIFLACCRALDLPARYISGYLFTGGRNREMASHAWVETWIPGQGWLALDVTNGRRTGAEHIRLATGLDYLDACPIRGMRRGGGRERMHVRVYVSDGQTADQ
jgi:transglutaminase-like putative cysteine protease